MSPHLHQPIWRSLLCSVLLNEKLGYRKLVAIDSILGLLKHFDSSDDGMCFVPGTIRERLKQAPHVLILILRQQQGVTQIFSQKNFSVGQASSHPITPLKLHTLVISTSVYSVLRTPLTTRIRGDFFIFLRPLPYLTLILSPNL